MTAKLLFSPQLASDPWWGLPTPTFWDHWNRRRAGSSLNQRSNHRWRCRGTIPIHHPGSPSGRGTAGVWSKFAQPKRSDLGGLTNEANRGRSPLVSYNLFSFILEIIFPLHDKGFHFQAIGNTLPVKEYHLKRQSFNC